MIKVFVAQTHERHRNLAAEFLKSSGYDDVSLYGTDPVSLTWLTREMMFATKPFAVLASQRNMFGCDYISNLIQTVTLNLPIKTLLIVYSTAAAHPQINPDMSRIFLKLAETPVHQFKIVPKVSESTISEEHDTIHEYLSAFEQSLT